MAKYEGLVGSYSLGVPREAGAAPEHAWALGECGRGEGAAASVNDLPVHQRLQVGTSWATRVLRAAVCILWPHSAQSYCFLSMA